MKSGQRGVAITDFADENDIGILPQDRPQRLRKRKTGFFVDLYLTDAIHFVLYGILDCYDVDGFLADFVDQGIQRRCLSATCRTDGQQHALRPTYKPKQALFDLLLKTKLAKRHHRTAATQQSNHDFFAPARWQYGYAKVRSI